MKLSAIKDVIRSGGYAWPGGYPLYFITSDCDALSIAAARKRWRDIVAAHLANNTHDDFYIAGAYVNWDDDSIYCVETGAKIESAYGDQNND